MPGIVYALFCVVSGKFYVGQTWGTLERRWRAHQRRESRCIKLRNAIAKYGADSFVPSVLVAGLNTQADMDAAEDYWICQLDTINEGYNLKRGGASGRPSAEVRAKISASHLGARNPFFGRRHTEAAREGMAAQRRGRPLPPSHRAHLVAALIGRKHSDASRERIRDAQVQVWCSKRMAGENPYIPTFAGRRHSPETLKKMRASHSGTTGCRFSEETRRRMSESQRRRRAREAGADVEQGHDLAVPS